MSGTSTLASEGQWDEQAVRRTLRLLASHSPNIADIEGRERAVRLLWDILNRRGIPAEIYEAPHAPSLLVAGNGPVLVVAHLDDAHPLAQVDGVLPPTIAGGIANGPGVIRKGAVLSAIGLLASQLDASRITLLIELDRYDGSRALDAWISGPGAGRRFSRAFVEAADLPVPAPAIFQGATGRVVLDLSVTDDRPQIEASFAGVVTDVGHELAQTLASLKTPEGEILVPGFYDAIVTPEGRETAVLHEIAPYVAGWVTRDRPDASGRLPSSHITLGAFLAPSLSVISVEIPPATPWLPRIGRATIDARIMPGQDAGSMARALANHVERRSDRIKATPLLVRPSARGAAMSEGEIDAGTVICPIAPGDSPAGLLEHAGIPTLGFSTTWRDPSAFDEQIELATIINGTAFLSRLASRA